MKNLSIADKLYKNSKVFTEREAFAFSKKYYENNLPVKSSNPLYKESLDLINKLQNEILRPSIELQVMGLCLLSHEERNRIWLPVSFAYFIIDHIIIGVFSYLISYFRVSYTLSRNIIEASIFEYGSEKATSKFEKLWNNKATGYQILREFKKSNLIDSEMVNIFDKAWKGLVSLGHASHIPVLFSTQLLSSGNNKFKIITMGGTNICGLNKNAIKYLSIIYLLVSEIALETMSLSVKKYFSKKNMWSNLLQEHREKVNLIDLCNTNYVLSEQYKDSYKSDSNLKSQFNEVLFEELLDISFDFVSDIK